jgi:hypothetical protein
MQEKSKIPNISQASYACIPNVFITPQGVEKQLVPSWSQQGLWPWWNTSKNLYAELAPSISSWLCFIFHAASSYTTLPSSLLFLLSSHFTDMYMLQSSRTYYPSLATLLSTWHTIIYLLIINMASGSHFPVRPNWSLQSITRLKSSTNKNKLTLSY